MRKDISKQLSNREIRKEEETSSSWKCYRCGLTFHEEWVASLHKEISNHSLKDGTN